MVTDALGDDLDRLVDRLRRLPEARLARPLASSETTSGTPSGAATAPGSSAAAWPATGPASTSTSGAAAVTVAPTPGTVADIAHRLAQLLADAARGVDGRAWPRPPEPREVPRLGDLASGDLVAVTGLDLRRAARRAAPADLVWLGGERRPLSEVLTDVGAEVSQLRRAT